MRQQHNSERSADCGPHFGAGEQDAHRHAPLVFVYVVTNPSQAGRCYGVAFSPDGRRLATVTLSDQLIVWDVLSGAEIYRQQGQSGNMYGVAFSPDGRRLVTAGLDKTVKLWDAATGDEILTLHGHTDAVWRAAFSPFSLRGNGLNPDCNLD